MTETDERARQIADSANEAIISACEGKSPLEWQTIADRIVTVRVGPEWEYLWLDRLGSPPTITITRKLT